MSEEERQEFLQFAKSHHDTSKRFDYTYMIGIVTSWLKQKGEKCDLEHAIEYHTNLKILATELK